MRYSGAEWTIVRSSWFSQNFSESYLLESIMSGDVALPVEDVGEPFVDAEDIADVAVAALIGDGHLGQVYELTGPRLLTFAEAIAEIADSTGRHIRFAPVTVDEYASLLAEADVPPDSVWLVTYLFTEVLDGRKRCLGHRRRTGGLMGTGFHRTLTVVALLGAGVVGGGLLRLLGLRDEGSWPPALT